MSTTRITGITSGFDTDTLVKNLMNAEKKKYDKLYKSKETLEWKKEAYREVGSKISDFQSNYFDVLKPSTNIRSASSFAKFTSSVMVNGVSNTAVTVSANSNLTELNHTITKISSLATSDTWNGSETYISSVKSGNLSSSFLSSLMAVADDDGAMEFSLSIDGTTKVISLTGKNISDAETAGDGNGTLSVEELVSALNSKISEEFGSDYDEVVTKIDGQDEIKFDFPGNDIVLLDSGSLGTLTSFGIESGSSNYKYLDKTIFGAFGITDNDLLNLSVNGKAITGLSSTDTVAEMMDKINASDTGATISYSSIEDRFVLKSNKEGSLNNITMDNTATSNFFSKLSINDDANRISAKNAVITIDDNVIVKSSNSFTVEGVNYNLNSQYLTGDPIDIKLNQNTDEVYDLIKGFVDEYNSLISSLNSTTNEVKDRDFSPLTEDERDALTEDEIEKWEAKAKAGLLSNDTIIDDFLNKMRRALYEGVEGVGISLRDIGISTTSDYTQRGKLEIDETKLKDAINNNYSDLVKLFTSESDKEYLDSESASERYNENGLAARLNDLIQDQIRTTRDSDNRKGILLEKAGKVDDTSFVNNIISKSISEYDTRIADALDYLADKEEYYYKMFTAMESALSKMNSQMASFSQQLGTGN